MERVYHSETFVPTCQFAATLLFILYRVKHGEKWIESIWKEVVLIQFQILSWHLPRLSEENHENRKSGWWLSWSSVLCSVRKIKFYNHTNLSEPLRENTKCDLGVSEKIKSRLRWIYSEVRLSTACACAWRHWSISQEQGTYPNPTRCNVALICPGDLVRVPKLLISESASVLCGEHYCILKSV